MSGMEAIYDKFTHAERVALVVEAMARKDHNEADRLIAACELKDYRMPDPAYTERLRAIHVQALHARLLMSERHALSLACMGVVQEYAGKTDRKSKKLFDEWADKLRDIDAQMRGIWFAWEEFCADAGIDAEKTLVMAWGEVPEHYRSGTCQVLLSLDCKPTEPDAEAYKMALGLFRHGLDIVESRYGGGTPRQSGH